MYKFFTVLTLLSSTLATSAWGQATTRPCTTDETVGPACLLARQEISSLPSKPLYWHLDQFVSKHAAEKAAISTSTLIEAFGSIWLFTIEAGSWRPNNGKHIADVGPLAVLPASKYAAEYLRSVFTPGMTAPLHVHSGPEGFYAVSGDTCLETPDGIQLARGPGNSLVIKGGPPMLLMAVGNEPRKGLALILHDAHQPPTTLTSEWYPQGLCQQQFSNDRAKP